MSINHKALNICTIVTLLFVSFVSANAANNRSPRNLDEQFGLVSNNLPEFGGMFYDKNGDLNIYLAGDAPKDKVDKVLVFVFGDERLRAPRGLANRPELGITRTLPEKAYKVIEAKYRFSQLKIWHDQMLANAFHQTGVVYLDIDETSNRIKVGVMDPAAHESGIRQILEDNNIPFDAVIVSQSEPVKQVSHTLRNTFRPVEGGTQIHFSSSLCTLGFNAYLAGIRGFVTNSHCSDFFGGFDGTAYYQSLYPNVIGAEGLDPLFFSGGVCPTGYQCRYSDSLFGIYNSTVASSLGVVAQPVFGTININHASPNLQIVLNWPYPVVGDIVDKVGRTTGWTNGRVGATCVTTGIFGLPNHLMLCQDIVDSFFGTVIVAGGDSGSPAFIKRVGNNVYLTGILWGQLNSGTSFVMSAMSNIQGELGLLSTY